jgi:hypothetical protein
MNCHHVYCGMDADALDPDIHALTSAGYFMTTVFAIKVPFPVANAVYASLSKDGIEFAALQVIRPEVAPGGFSRCSEVQCLLFWP